MKRLAISAVMLATLAGPAFAADLPVKAPAPPPPVFNWTGFYIGANAGGAVSLPSGTSDFQDTLGPIDGNPFGNPQQFSSANWSGLGGFQAGYNWQVNPLWVLGVEVDWDWMRTKYSFCRQTDIGSTACVDNGDGFETIASQTDWIGTARVRAGVTLDGILLYGTGGAAWGKVDTTLSQTCLVGPGCGANSLTPVATSSTTTTYRVGWVAGAGVEYALGANWSVKGEWLYVNLGKINSALSTVGNDGVNTGTQTTLWSRTEAYDIVRVGLNYRFGH